QTARVITTVLVFAAGLAIAWLGRRTLLAFVFAALFAYLLEPAIAWLQRRTGWARARSIAVAYVVIVCAVGAAIVIAAPRIVDEARKASGALPDMVQQVGNGKIVWQLGGQHGWSYSTEMQLERTLAAHQDDITATLQSLAGRAAIVSANAGWLALVPV